jgi:hypothetical protein
MTPKILMREPPNFDKIDAVFKVKGKPVIFAYGDAIYNPMCVPVATQIAAHEGIHLKQQIEMGPEAWWDRYLSDVRFRYQEEFVAHAMECAVRSKMMGGNRVAKRKSLIITALRLANNDLYKWSPRLSASAEKNKLRDFLEKQAAEYCA